MEHAKVMGSNPVLFLSSLKVFFRHFSSNALAAFTFIIMSTVN